VILILSARLIPASNFPSPMSNRLFARIFTFRSIVHFHSSYPVPLTFRDGTDPRFGGHRQRPGSRNPVVATALHMQGACR
jgi:hypothetical protein